MKQHDIPSSITLIFPEQLFENVLFPKERHIVLIEDSLIFGDRQYPLSLHFSKRVFHRATMKAYESYLLKSGFTVSYIEWEEHTIFTDQLEKLSLQEIHYADFSDVAREKRLTRFAKKNSVTLHKQKTPYFLNTRQENDVLVGNKKPRMQHFYTAQRKRFNILMEDDGMSPVGGKWSFDEDNRKKIPHKEITSIPEDLTPITNAFIEEARLYVSKRFPTKLGSGNIYVPVTHAQAHAWLKTFLDERFDLFGRYEDAMIDGKSQLYHSVLSPLINTGLLTPRIVLDAVLERYQSTAHSPELLASAEGFVRQLIGWREYMRAIYDIHGSALRTENAWKHERPLPQPFYDASTGIAPIDDVISRLLETGYSHHIERLMLMGNMMFLLRINPHDVYAWFSELYIDAYDWVMVGNVYGMSQCCKVDFMTTKPYICGSNYIKKMSNYKCDKDADTKDWCAIWDALYWQFIIDHENILRQNHRWKMMYAHIDRFDTTKKELYGKTTYDFIESLQRSGS